MRSDPKSPSRTGGIPEESRRGPEPDRDDAGTPESPPYLSRRVLSEAIPDQTQQIELLGAQIGEELARFDTLIEIHRRNGVAATVRNIRATAGPATIHRLQLLTDELLGAADARLARRTGESRRRSDLSVITAALATVFNLGLLGLLILLARRGIKG